MNISDNVLIDNAHKIKYSVGNPSIEYIMLTLDYINNNSDNIDISDFHSGFSYWWQVKNEESSILDYLAATTEFKTLQIESIQKISFEKFIRLSNSLAYEMAYNSRRPCSLAYTFNELLPEASLEPEERPRDTRGFIISEKNLYGSID